jgi:Putative transposase of IS4/5 family (DUF4096)
MWRFRTGSPWRDLPERYGPWQTVYKRFRAWTPAGIFQGLMDGLIAEAAARGQVDLSLVGVDSTVARAHQDSAGMAVSGEVLDALESALTEEKGVPLEQQENFRYRVVRAGRIGPTLSARRNTGNARLDAVRASAAGPAPVPPHSGVPKVD